MNIGLKLKELRILKGLTQEELADRAELSKGFISQLERNLTSPSIATLLDINAWEQPLVNFLMNHQKNKLYSANLITLKNWTPN